MNIPSTFWDYATQNWLKDAPVFPISQVFGFSQYTAQSAQVTTQESTTSASLTDLATVGPTISNLPDGKYIIFFGCQAKCATDSAVMGVRVNSTDPTSTEIIQAKSTDFVSISGVVVKSLSNSGNNTLKGRYQSPGGVTANFATRYLVALRYGNL